jgi:hypothetical protein
LFEETEPLTDMTRTGNFVNAVARRTPAFLCLFALLLFQTPVIGAAVLASGLCCTGDHCPIAAHHHSSAKTPKTEGAPMDCEHGAKGDAAKLQSCSMSCCQTTEQSAVHAQVFVLSPDVTPPAFVPLAEAVSVTTFDEEIGSFSPLSPPPKSTASLV